MVALVVFLILVACVCLVFTVISALGFIFVPGRRRPMAATFLWSASMAACCLAICTHEWRKAPPDDSAETAAALSATSPDSKPVYDAAAIIGHAEQAYRDKHYDVAEDLLMQLHVSDLNQPKPHALLSTVSRLAERQRTLQEASDRVGFAQDYESALLSAGIDATVRAKGAGNKTLYLSTPFMSRPLVYQILNPEEHAKSDLAEGNVWRAMTDDRTDLPALWRSKGFERVIFSDGSDNTWAYKLD